MVSEELKKQHPTQKSVLELISDIGADYDGYITIEGIKVLVDEIIELAEYGITLDK